MDVVALLTGADDAATCLDAAAVMAGGGRLRALHVEVDPDNLRAASEEIEVQRLRAARHGASATREAAVGAAFAAWAGAHRDVDASFDSVAGALAEVLAERVGAATLVALPRPDTIDGADALHALAFDLRRPVLLIPAGWTARPLERVLVAWSGSPASHRAAELAAPWLREAGEVALLRIGEAVREPAAIDGVTCRPIDRARDPGLPIAAQIAREAHRSDAAMIVAGAYRHAAAVEWLLGGTTRALIAAADRPLFLAHGG